MAVDAVDAVLNEFEEWAVRTGRAVDLDEIRILLELSRDYLSHRTPPEFAPGDLDKLLLSVYPHHIVVASEQAAAQVISHVRDLVAFLGDNGRPITGLDQEIDEIEPLFFGAATNPANWSPEQHTVRAMIGDGVDLTDQEAVDAWLAEHGIVDDDEEDDDAFLDLLDELGLAPGGVAPMRLPDIAELATAAKQCEPLAMARKFADLVAAGQPADSLGLSPVELAHVRQLAEAVEFVVVTEDESVQPGVGLDFWPDGDDEEVVDTWKVALADLLALSLELDAELAEADDVDFTATGPGMFMMMFSMRGDGVPVAEMSEVGRVPEPAWDAWVAEHGDPIRVLVARLVALGAVVVDDEDVARLTPLSMSAMRDQMIEAGGEVPLLPPPAEMTADDLADIIGIFSEDELAAELAAWLEHRSAEQAARELLEVAAVGDAVERIWATSVVNDLDAEAVWPEFLDQQALRPYARIALDEELDDDDRGWLAVDAIAISLDDPDELVQSVLRAAPFGQEEALFEIMWRLPHPDVHDVLEAVGQFHPTKKVAKLARRAAHKAATRVHPAE
jgi:hypothetical protein